MILHLFFFILYLWLKREVSIDLRSDSLEELSEADVSALDLVTDTDAIIVENHFRLESLAQHFTTCKKTFIQKYNCLYLLRFACKCSGILLWITNLHWKGLFQFLLLTKLHYNSSSDIWDYINQHFTLTQFDMFQAGSREHVFLYSKHPGDFSCKV